tara:strand:+ start:2761 stop:3294 length:534 start_codon:yes stop_codon:yes gene_type:complete
MAHDGKFKNGPLHSRWVDIQEAFIDVQRNYSLGTLVPIKIDRHGGYIVVECHCIECGEYYLVQLSNIRSGKTTNCRCQRRLKYRTHAERQLGERYDAALQRCRNPSNPNYANYGGRGIRVKLSREEYIKHLVAIHPLNNYSGWDVDRVNNDGHYETGNLRVVSRADNLMNRRRSRRN